MRLGTTTFDLSPAHVVFELDEAATTSGHSLELHVERINGIGMIAWWCTEWGEVLAVVDVGRA